MSLVKRGSPKKIVAMEPVTKYRRPILSKASMTNRSRSDCSMRESPGGLLLDALLVPVRMLRGEMTGDHAPRGAEHIAGDLQALGPGHGAEYGRHFLVQDLDIPGIDRHLLKDIILFAGVRFALTPP